MNHPIMTALLKPEHRRLLLPVGAGIVLFAIGSWWLLRTPLVNLDVALSPAAQQEALAALHSAGIHYQTTADGAIQVPAEQLPKAQTELTRSGLAFPEPRGFELLDNSDYAMSDYSQRLNFQRALEGELARTIMGLQEVRSARVHLSIVKAGLFNANRNVSKASVTLQLKPGQQLSAPATDGIRDIIASSVEGLKPENVAIIDDSGLPLAGMASGNTELRTVFARSLEIDLEERVRQLLRDSYGISNPYVSVRADLNFDKITAVRDGAVPTEDATGLLTREQTTDAMPAENHAGGTSSATREYVYAREHVETEFSSGTLTRLSIAVALPASDTALDLSAIEKIIGAAIGLRAERGDKLVVALVPALALAGEPSSNPGIERAAPALTATVKPPPTESEPSPPGNHRDIALMLVAVLMLMMFTALVLRTRSARQQAVAANAPRMTDSQRQQLLSELQQWLRTN